MAQTPNLDKLEAILLAIGDTPSISYQLRDATFGGERTGFFTVTFYPRADLRCAIGQGDTLAEALLAARADATALTANVDVADLEKVAA
jgi:hypothetical protein